jgi:hypothetical protein
VFNAQLASARIARSAGSLQDFDVAGELGAETVSFDLQVVRGLQIEPETR